MDVRNALTHAIESSGMTRYAVAKKLGKSTNYIYNLFNKDTSPSFVTIANIADVCGHDVILKSRETGEEIPLDVPPMKK